MTFVKGRSGNPGGRPKGTAFGSVLAARLEEVKDGKTTREQIVGAVVDKALDGDLEAVKWIADRTDGKVKDSNELSGELIVRVLRDRTA